MGNDLLSDKGKRQNNEARACIRRGRRLALPSFRIPWSHRHQKGEQLRVAKAIPGMERRHSLPGHLHETRAVGRCRPRRTGANEHRLDFHAIHHILCRDVECFDVLIHLVQIAGSTTTTAGKRIDLACRHTYGSILLPSNLRNCPIHSGCAGQAAAVTRLPSVYAFV